MISRNFCLITAVRFFRACQKSEFEVKFENIISSQQSHWNLLKKAENPWKQRLSALLAGVPKRTWTSDPTLRRAPTYCHSLSIWGKVNPYGTLLKTVSDSIWVILNTPSVKLCKALKVSWLFAPANNWGMPWYYHRHLLYDHHASYVRSW